MCVEAPKGQGWTVFVVDEQDVHVVPTLDGEVIAGHELIRDCACAPTVERDSPLDEPIWSHVEPSWPGANPSVLH